MKKIDWILEHTRKPVWGLCFVSAILFVMVFPLTGTGMKFFLGFFSPWYEGELLNHSFEESVERGDYVTALKIMEEFEPWEKKAAAYQTKRDKKIDVFKNYRFSYPSRYILTYDLLGKYDEALTWIIKLQDIPDVADSRIYPTPQNYLAEYLFAAEARIHFKNGEKRKAFLNYISIYERRLNKVQFSFERFPLVYGEGIKYLLTMNHDCGSSQCRECNRNTSCFDYSEFFDFMKKEFEELGSPEECREAMDFFRELNDMPFDYAAYAEQERSKTLEEKKKEWGDWEENYQVPFGHVISVVDHVCKSREKRTRMDP